MVATRQAEVSRWEEAHNRYRSLLATLSLTLHPFRIADSAPQTSAEGASHLQAPVTAIEELTQSHPWPVRHAAMTKVRKQLPALAAVVDFWQIFPPLFSDIYFQINWLSHFRRYGVVM